MIRRLVFAAIALVALLAIPGVASAASTVANGTGSDYVLTGTSGDNGLRVYDDNGQWVIFDLGGDVDTSGSRCIGRALGGRRAVSCPKGSLLTINAGDGKDSVQVAVTGANVFSGRLKVNGGPGDDQLQGGNGNDELNGDDGNDKLDGQAGGDIMRGGPGLGDECCYRQRGSDEDVSITLDGIANDGSQETDSKADNVDASTEKLYAGAGNDTINTSSVSTAGCVAAPRFELHAGGGNDHLTGNACYGDDLDGGDGLDTGHYEFRSAGLALTQDDLANDGALGTTERDNLRSNVEIVIGGNGNDIISGADGPPTDNSVAHAALIGWAGNDTIVPGTRSENLIADGWGTQEGAGDALMYTGRTTPVTVALDGQPNDGASDANAKATENDNVADGFDRILLGSGNDFYFGPHSTGIPTAKLSDYETATTRIDVEGGGGDDKLYPGSTAEDLHGDGGTDLTSYIQRQPSNSLMQVELSLDGKANDGQVLELARVAPEMAMLLSGPMVAVGKRAFTVTVDESAAMLETKIVSLWTKEGKLISSTVIDWGDKGVQVYVPGGGVPTIARGAEALEWIKQLRMVVAEAELVTEEIKTEVAIAEAYFERALQGGTVSGFVYGWPQAFSGLKSEQDNIDDDVEQLQGSNNGGLYLGVLLLAGAPIDYIRGNDRANTVFGSPGPDSVSGGGGDDVLIGDLPGQASNDSLTGGDGRDALFGGGGNDIIEGGPGTDTLFANDLGNAPDGWRDFLYCDRLDFPTSEADEFKPPTDRGVFENDRAFASRDDLDFIGPLCQGGGTNNPASATGATADTERGVLTIKAAAGQRNKLKLSTSGSSITIDDSADVTAMDGCTPSAGNAVCGAFGVTKVVVDTGDLKDTVDLSRLTGVRTTVNLGDGNDKITGSPGADTINGGTGKDKIKARAGNDTLDGGDGADLLDGGDGSDTIDYSGRTGPVDVYLAQPSTKGNGATTQTLDNFNQDLRVQRSLENDTIKWAENVIGGSGNDILQGNQFANRIDARNGDDALSGGAGDDALLPGLDRDQVLAGDGNDSIRALDGYADRKLDCGPGADSGDRDTFDQQVIGCEF